MVMSYDQWCNYMELKYDFMPQWWWNKATRIKSYEAYAEVFRNWGTKPDNMEEG